MTTPADETFGQFIWRSCKHPLQAFVGSPMAQSAAAFAINVWCLILAPLGQLWVFGSAALLLAQTHNTWSVAAGHRSRALALLIGLILVGINFGALTLAVLAQFWVFASLALALWQYVSLIRVCFGSRKSP
jgi:hypothetical protein